MYVCKMMTVQKEIGKGFNLQTTQAQGFTQSWKLCLNLCLLRWLNPNPGLNLVRNFKPMGLWMLKVGLAVGRPIFIKEFLKDKKILIFLFAYQVCSILEWHMGNNNIWIHLSCNKML